jgi:hypothetical protein
MHNWYVHLKKKGKHAFMLALQNVEYYEKSLCLGKSKTSCGFNLL